MSEEVIENKQKKILWIEFLGGDQVYLNSFDPETGGNLDLLDSIRAWQALAKLIIQCAGRWAEHQTIGDEERGRAELIVERLRCALLEFDPDGFDM